MSLVAVASAAVPWLINYQGRLTDAEGKVVTGTYTFTFRLYDASTGGTEQWKEQQTITLTESDSGIFNTVLGSVTVLTSVDFNTPMWLSVQVGDDSEMTPRQRMTAVGYAMNADQLDSLDSSKFLRTDVDTSTSGKLTITRAGAALLIKPSTDPDADTKLIDVQNAAGTSKFSVDLEGDATVGGDLTVASGMRIGTGSTPDNFTALADDSLFIEGNLEVDGTIYGNVSGSTSVTGTTGSSFTIGSSVDATSSDLSLLFGQTSGQESIVFDGDSTDDFLLSDDLQLLAQSDLRFADSDSSNYLAFQAPATVSSNVTWTLPGADGSSSQALTTDGSGTLSWATVDTSSSNEAPVDASYITQTANSTLTGEQALSTLSTGIMKVTTSTGVISSLGDPLPVANGGTGATSLNDLLTLGTHTSGNYVASVGTSSPLSGGASGSEGAALTISCPTCVTSASGGTFALTLSGDSGSDQTLSAGDTLEIAGGTNGIDTSAGSTDTVTLNFDSTEVGTTTWGANSDFTWTFDGSGSSGASTEPAITFGSASVLVNTGNNANLATTGSGGNLALNDVSAANALVVVSDNTQNASDGVLKLGKSAANTYEYIWYDNSADKFVLSTSIRVLGSSPSTLEFGDGTTGSKTLTFDSTSDTPFTFNDKVSVVDLNIQGSSPAGITFGSGTNAQTFSFDPNAGGEFTFSGGVFAQQFRNLVKNGSFESFSAQETFASSTATCPSGAGSCGGSGSTFYGGWQNFAPDEWTWDAGNVFQNSPFMFTPGSTVTSTYLQQEYYHGKSAVTLEDTNGSSTDGPYNTSKDQASSYSSSYYDAHLEQTITGLKPSTVYSVGAYMRVENSSTTEAIVDVTGEDVATSATLTNAQLTSTSTTVNVTSGVSSFPDSGILLIDSERISYAGKDNTNNKFTFCIRGFDGTTAAAHNASSTVTIAPFKHLTTSGSSTATTFTLYKGQFATTNKAEDVKIRLICTSTDTTIPYDKCRYDAVQIVEGRSVPEFQPSAIVDTGDQTLYGALRLGRTGNDRGGILSVDKSVRTRAIEFFEKDPGMSGTSGGFGGVGSATKIGVGTGSTLTTLSTSGTFFGSNPRDILVTVTPTSSQFEWKYRECFPSTGCSGTYTTGGSNLSISNYLSLESASNPLPGSMGLKIAFGSGSAAVNDQWSFFVSGMNMAQQYNSYSGTATYTPGNTRIYKDAATGKLMFQDGSTIASLQDIVGVGVGGSAHVDYPIFFPASSGGGTMSLNTSQGYTGSSQRTFDVQICANGSGSTRDSYQWRDNVANGGGAAADWDIVCTQIPASGGPTSALSIGAPENTSYGFTITFASPGGAWQDGNIGDRWQINAYASGTSATVKTSDVGTVTSTMLADGTIATGDLANNSVAGTKIALGSDAQGDVMYYNGTDWARLGAGTTGQFLKTGGVGANPSWDTVSSGTTLPVADTTAVVKGSVDATKQVKFEVDGFATTGTTRTLTIPDADGTIYVSGGTDVAIADGGTGASTATAAFNALSPSTTLGDLIYHDGTDDVRLAGNTTAVKQFLSQTGNGSVSAAPAWVALADADVPNILTFTQLNDTNANELLKFTATTNAVNELTLANAATGGAPSLTASGGDTNISINLVPKGAGTVQVNGTAVLTSESDPQVGTLTNTKWCTTDGTAVNCTSNAPSANTTGVVPIEILLADPSAPPASSIMGNTPTADFAGDADDIAYFTLRVPDDVDTTQPMTLKLNYAMSTAETGNVVMALDYEVVADDGDTTPASFTASTSDTINPPDTAETLDIFTGTNLQVAAVNLGAAGRNINCKIYRDADSASDTHAGLFKLLNIALVYTRSSS